MRKDLLNSRLEAAADQDWSVTPPSLDDINGARQRQDRHLVVRRTAAALACGVLVLGFVITRSARGDSDAIIATSPPVVNDTRAAPSSTEAPAGDVVSFVAYPSAAGEYCLVLRDGGEDLQACNLLPGPSLWKVRGRYYLVQPASLDYEGRRIVAPAGHAVIVRLLSNEPPDVVPLKERGTRPTPDPNAACFSPSVADALAARYPRPGSGGETGYPFITVNCGANTAQVAMAGPTSEATVTRVGSQWVAS